MDELTPDEVELLADRIGDDGFTRGQLAQRYGVSEQQIKKLTRRALAKLQPAQRERYRAALARNGGKTTLIRPIQLSLCRGSDQ